MTDCAAQQCQQLHNYPGLSFMGWEWLLQLQLLHLNPRKELIKTKGPSAPGTREQKFQKSLAEFCFLLISKNRVTRPPPASVQLALASHSSLRAGAFSALLPLCVRVLMHSADKLLDPSYTSGGEMGAPSGQQPLRTKLRCSFPYED